MERREFMGFAVAAAPLAAIQEREIKRLTAVPLNRPRLVEWLNEIDRERDVYSRLGRYLAPLTEAVLLEAITTCGIEKPKAITLSTMGATDYLSAIQGERRYSVHDGPSRMYRHDDEDLVLMAPGHQLWIEVHFGLPNGFLTIG